MNKERQWTDMVVEAQGLPLASLVITLRMITHERLVRALP